MDSSVNPMAMYVMFDLKLADKNIFYWENVVSYPEQLIEFIEELDLINESHDLVAKWEPWYASTDMQTIYGKRKHIITKDRHNDSGNTRLNQKALYVVNSLMMAPEMCAINFSKMLGMDKSEINLDLSHISLSKYENGMGMGPHCDASDPNGTGTNLRYSLVTYLNDDYEGGELHFKDHNITIKPKAGSLVLFPSTEPYYHESKPLKSGVKYMYTTHWLVNNVV